MRRLYTSLALIVAILIVAAGTTMLKAVSSAPIGVRKTSLRQTVRADGTYTVPSSPKVPRPGYLTRMPFLPSDPRQFGVVTVTI